MANSKSNQGYSYWRKRRDIVCYVDTYDSETDMAVEAFENDGCKEFDYI